MSHNKPIRVLIVDDSAYMRKTLTQMLSSSPQIEVIGTAANGIEALEKVASLAPEVVTLDLYMPQFDGLGFLKRQMSIQPLPVVICTSAGENDFKVIEALHAGATEVVQKPTNQSNERVYEIESQLIEKVIAAANSQVAKLANGRAEKSKERIAMPVERKGLVDAVVIGVSTGGPHALRLALPQFPADFPVPIAVVLHMPLGFTQPFAERLDHLTALEVLEASDGLEMRPGRVILAQAGKHLLLRRGDEGQVMVKLSLNPSGLSHRPSVNVLFQSAAEVYGERTLGVVLTGMGSDGMEGAAWIKSQGGKIIAEHESSSVIYGMPRAVVEAGLADHVIPLDQIPRAIIDLI